MPDSKSVISRSDQLVETIKLISLGKLIKGKYINKFDY
jgi:hypothetical protein